MLSPLLGTYVCCVSIGMELIAPAEIGSALAWNGTPKPGLLWQRCLSFTKP